MLYEEWKQLSERDQHIISDIFELLKEHGITPLETAVRLCSAEHVCEALSWYDGINRPQLKSRLYVPLTQSSFDELVIECAWILHAHNVPDTHSGIGQLWLQIAEVIKTMGMYVPESWHPFQNKSWAEYPRWIQLAEITGTPYEIACAHAVTR